MKNSHTDKVLTSGVCTEILKTSHGRRSIDVLSILAPDKANWDCKLPPHSWPTHPSPKEHPSTGKRKTPS
jgi:hypothetical protein